MNIRENNKKINIPASDAMWFGNNRLLLAQIISSESYIKYIICLYSKLVHLSAHSRPLGVSLGSSLSPILFYSSNPYQAYVWYQHSSGISL